MSYYGMTRAVRQAGRLVADFAGTKWTGGGAGNSLVTDYTGFHPTSGERLGVVSRSGLPRMMQWVVNSDTTATIQLASPLTNLRTRDLNGQIVLLVHVANMPRWAPNQSPTSHIQINVTTDAGEAYNNSLWVNWTQVREGWNFLKFKMRDPAAYVQGSGVTEYHPNGTVVLGYGTGAWTNIVDNQITGIKLMAENLGGATLTFDSIRTGVDTVADVVLGVDQQTSDTQSLVLPMFQSKGWKGYFAAPARIYSSGDTTLNDIGAVDFTVGKVLYAAGWDCVNHTINHRTHNTYTDAAAIDYEVSHARAMYLQHGMKRGNEFYASPSGSTSRLAEQVIGDAGFVLQRHSLKMCNTVLPWGIDNPQNLGGTPLDVTSGAQLVAVTGGAYSTVAGTMVFSKIKRFVDVIEAYGDAWFPYWHAVTTLGDSGSGEDTAGAVTITYSALSKTLDYIAEREASGNLRVRDGITGWYYGIGR